MHHEIAPGQHEMDFRFAHAMKTADNIVTFRVALKILAQQQGLYATFMPKAHPRHRRQRHARAPELCYAANGSNAFSDPGDGHGLSTIAKRFMAGSCCTPGACAPCLRRW